MELDILRKVENRMRLELTYDECPYLDIREMSVIGTFNNFDIEKGKMVKNDNRWKYETNVEPGEYIYKFVVNGEIQLPDPTNNLYDCKDENELWSLVIIDQDGMRRYNNTQYTANIEDYTLSSFKTKRASLQNKKHFSVITEKQVVARFKFNNITGLHLITAVWYQPNKHPYTYSENSLYAETQIDEVILWFWLDINVIQNGNSGIWCLKLFVDGDFILEDLFTIEFSNIEKIENQQIYI